jgi:pimeloyl-ACP methyl ester carboxylesterase
MTRSADAAWLRSVETIAGCTVSVRSGGTGPALLFLHGASTVPEGAPFLDGLARRFSVVCPDHPGYGRSATPDWLDNIHDMAFFYLDFMAALGLEDVHLVGASLGGWIAAEIAVRSTARIARLSLVAPAGIHVRGVAKPDIFLMSAEELTRHLYADPNLIEAALARLVAPEEEEAALRNRFMTARLGWQPRFYDPHLEKWLHRIDRPTQILWGCEDRILPPAYAEHWRRLVPGSTIALFEGCGHLPQIEQPEAFAAAIAAFAGEGRR